MLGTGLFIAHLFSDFVWQPSSWVKAKRNTKGWSKYMLYHIGLTVLLAAFPLLLVAPEHWYLLIVIGLSHWAIDLVKLRAKDNLTNFLSDQAAHLVVLWACTFWVFREQHTTLLSELLGPKTWVYFGAYLTLIWPAGHLMRILTERWQKEIDTQAESLKEAGRLIGILERILVVVFIHTGHFEAIGFLITAKSILRFSDTAARKHAEYVLIGTMSSFLIAIVVGLCSLAVINNL